MSRQEKQFIGVERYTKEYIEEQYQDMKLPSSMVIMDKKNENILIDRKWLQNNFVSERIYPMVIIQNCLNCEIVIDTKILKLLTLDCTNIKLVAKCQTVGPLEFFRCHNSKIDLSYAPPFITVEMSDSLVFSSLSDITYWLLNICSGPLYCVSMFSKISSIQYSMFPDRYFYFYNSDTVELIKIETVVSTQQINTIVFQQTKNQ